MASHELQAAVAAMSCPISFAEPGGPRTCQTMSDATPSIRLDNFLKTAGLTATGGQAKVLIQSGQVMVNGEVEIRRRKQLKPGDVVQALGETFEVSNENIPNDPETADDEF